MSDLAERLEKATGPDREIDLDLMVLGWGGPRERYLTDELGRLAFGDQRQFTSSLDAAVALCERVLPGWGVEVLASDRDNWRAAVWPWISSRGTRDERGFNYSYAPTPALALCLAVVRAKLAEAE